MRKLAVISFLSPLVFYSLAADGPYKAEPAGGPPSEVAPAIAQALQKDGTRISNNGAPYCEIWFRSQKPSGPKSTEENVTLPLIPAGALLGQEEDLVETLARRHAGGALRVVQSVRDLRIRRHCARLAPITCPDQ